MVPHQHFDDVEGNLMKKEKETESYLDAGSSILLRPQETTMPRVVEGSVESMDPVRHPCAAAATPPSPAHALFSRAPPPARALARARHRSPAFSRPPAFSARFLLFQRRLRVEQASRTATVVRLHLLFTGRRSSGRGSFPLPRVRLWSALPARVAGPAAGMAALVAGKGSPAATGPRRNSPPPFPGRSCSNPAPLLPVPAPRRRGGADLLQATARGGPPPPAVQAPPVPLRPDVLLP